MKLHISNSAVPGDGSEPAWFVVLPLPGRTEVSAAGTPITHDMVVASLLRHGRTVFELDTRTAQPVQGQVTGAQAAQHLDGPLPPFRQHWWQRARGPVTGSGYAGPERRGQQS